MKKKYPRGGLKRKVWLTVTQVQEMIDTAKARSKRDFLIMLLLRWSLRVGEVVGHDRLPGIYVEDVRDDGILIKGKGWLRGIAGMGPSPYTTGQVKIQPIPSDVIELLKSYIHDVGRGPNTKVFDLSERMAEYLIKDYARRAGVPEGDWQLITPHRLRAFFASHARWTKDMDSIIIRDLMRHRSLRDTEVYLGRAPPDYLASKVRELSQSSQSPATTS